MTLGDGAGLINPHEHLTFSEGPPIPTTQRYQHRHDWRGSLSTPSNAHGTGSTGNLNRWVEIRQLLGGATTIVGVDLRTVESVLGRWSWGRSALSGLATGAWFGLLLGLFVSLFATAQSGTSRLVLMGLLYGAAFGIVFGLLSYAVTRGRRDFVSRQSLVAGRYDVLCEADVLARARQVLNGGRVQWPPPLPEDDGGDPATGTAPGTGQSDNRPDPPRTQ